MKKHGFSLLELMVAVLITSLVVIAGFSLMISSKDGFKNESSRKMLEANMRNAEQIIQRDLSRVGYHTLMDSQFEFENQDVSKSGFSGDFQAFRSFGRDEDDIGEQFAFIADLTNFTDGFPVASQAGLVLSMNANGLENGRTAQQIQIIADDPSIKLSNNSVKPKVISETNYAVEFQKAFRDAKAIFAFSPDNLQVIMRLAKGGVGLDAKTLTIVQNPPETLGFEVGTPLREVSVYPVVGVVYRIVNDGGVYSLQRCYSTDLENQGVDNEKVSHCQVMIRNVRSFELYPIFAGANSTLNDFFTETENGVHLAAGHHWMKSATDNASNATVTNLIGFVYRLEAAGLTPANEVSANTPGYDANKYPVSSIQGTVLMTTRNNYRLNGKTLVSVEEGG